MASQVRDEATDNWNDTVAADRFTRLGFIKLVADSERGVLVAATSPGPMGGEVLGMLTLAVHTPVPLSRLREMIYAYPAFHRAVEDTLRRLG